MKITVLVVRFQMEKKKKMIKDKEFQELEKMSKLKFEEKKKKKIMIELNKIIDKLKILSREK